MTGTSAVDASMLPGESVPVEVGKWTRSPARPSTLAFVTQRLSWPEARPAKQYVTAAPQTTGNLQADASDPSLSLGWQGVRGQRGDQLICPLWFVVDDLTQAIRTYITRISVRVWWTNPSGRQRYRKGSDS